MEITKVFKACAKAAKMRNKDIVTDILPRKKKEGSNEKSFNAKALEVVKSITKLKEILLTHQSDYLNEFSPISRTFKMLEEDRDQMDKDAETFVKSCSATIKNLRTEVNKTKEENNNLLHSNAVIDLLDGYLVGVSKVYSQLRALRVKQTVEKKKMSRLKPDKRSLTNDIKLKADNTMTAKKETHEASKQELRTTKASNVAILEDSSNEKQFHFTPEETQMLEQENAELYNEMNNLVKEIQNIEGKVIGIGHLQEVFQEKVLSQSEQIEGLHGTAVSTTENVKEGNEEIREAIKNSATFRVWVLFFLVMCTFSLLFLDWYND